MFILKKHVFPRSLVKSYHTNHATKIGIVGAPYARGQPHLGVSSGPDAIRSTGVIEALKHLGHDVRDFGNVYSRSVHDVTDLHDSDAHIVNQNLTMEYASKLKERITRVFEDQRVCITLGGDHSVGIATLDAHLEWEKETRVLWIDAHADINTPETSTSGNVHGMSLAYNIVEMKHVLLKHCERFKERVAINPKLLANRVAYIGLRSVDPLEMNFLDSLNIPFYSMREIDMYGIRRCLTLALEKINPDYKYPMHVSFDIDSLDPSDAPATGTPVIGGLTLREGLTLLEDIYNTGQLKAIDLVEVNPHLGDSASAVKRTLEASKLLILAACGSYLGGRL